MTIKDLTRVILAPGIVAVVSTLSALVPIAWSLCPYGSAFPAWYLKDLRVDVFNGSATTAGFLLSVLTFIATSMKTDVYDTDLYRKEHEITEKKIGRKLPIYAPLRNLIRLMTIAVGASLLSAVAHVSLIFVKSHWAPIACAALAAATLALVGFAVLAGYLNFSASLKYAESRARPAAPTGRAAA